MARPPWHDEHQRLRVALRKTRTLYAIDPSGRDADTGTDIANKWMFITLCYSGIEQCLKVIAAASRGLSVADLRKEVPRGRGHDLTILFETIDHDAKCILMQYYAHFQSLYSYIPIDSLPEFLRSISRTDGRGYERWRYSLIETDSELPTNSIEAMLAIWTSCVQLIGQRLGIEQVILPERGLMRQLGMLLPRVSTERDTIDPVWKDCYEEPINHAAQLLWEERRGILTRPSWILAWVEAVKEESKDSKELRHFINRATGNTTSGLGILWNYERKRFEAIPWNLVAVAEEKIPAGAREPYSDVSIAGPDVLRRVYENGYNVRENWACGSCLDGRWWRTIVAEKIDASGTQGALTAWLHNYDLFVRLEGAATQLLSPMDFK